MWREQSFERFVIQVSIVHRHFSGVIELGVIHDNLCLQFCSQSRSGMEHRCLEHRAIVHRFSDNRNLVSAGALMAVDLNTRFGFLAH